MKKLKPILLGASLLLGLTACSSSDDSASATTMTTTSSDSAAVTSSEHIVSVTQIGEGPMATAIAIEYDAEIDASSLAVEDFTIDGGTVTEVYTNSAAEVTDTSAVGKYVIVEMTSNFGGGGGGRPDDAAAADGGTPPSGEAPADGTTPPSGEASADGTTPPANGKNGGGDNRPSRSVSVTQSGEVSTADGEVYAADTVKVQSVAATE